MVAFSFLLWWLRRATADAKRELHRWARDPEWPLLHVGLAFFGSFVFHWIGYRMAMHRIGWNEPFFAPTEWEGRTGWRKPLVFGISNAMIFVSLRYAFLEQQLVSRRLAAHLTAWSTALEVGVITLQAWRGVPSHFNTTTNLDAWLYIMKLCGALILSLCCIAATVGTQLRHKTHLSPHAIALRHGLLLLCLSIAVGISQVVYGHHKRELQEQEISPCLVATAGVTGSPCYEIHGEAIVKLAHFLPLHATEALLFLAWASNAASIPQTTSTKMMRLSVASCWVLSIFGLWLVWQGINIKSIPVGLTMLVILAPFLVSCVWVLLAPLGRVHDLCSKKDDGAKASLSEGKAGGS